MAAGFVERLDRIPDTLFAFLLPGGHFRAQRGSRDNRRLALTVMPLRYRRSQGVGPLRALQADVIIPIVLPIELCAPGGEAMTQTTSRFFDEVARLMNDAAGVASGVRREFDTMMRAQAERILRDLDVVKREEFEAVKEMARLAREENEALKARLEALEAGAKSRKAKPAAAEGGSSAGSGPSTTGG
jgi:BMFP domain-containing protein YqiC